MKMNPGLSEDEDFIEMERNMFLNAENIYGDFFRNAIEFNLFLNNFIKSVDDIEKYLSLAFWGQVKKHHMLALFSAVRRHHIQAQMNIRQVLEASVQMAYAMGNKEKEKFYEDEDGIITVPEDLKKKGYVWLEKEFKVGSDTIKRLKKQINETTAHSNLIYTFQNFKPEIEKGIFNFSFFDDYDELKVKSDLWFIGNIALGLLDLFYGINEKYKVFQLVDDFIPRLKALEQKNNELKKILMNNPRFQKNIPQSI